MNKCTDKCAVVKCSSGYTCESGQCIPLCSKIRCPVNTVCINGYCVINNFCRKDSECKPDEFCANGKCIDKCSKVVCPKGSTCDNGECKLDLNVCPSDTDYDARPCVGPRPTEATCPTLYYIMAPTANVCGIRKDGSMAYFVRFC